MGALDGKVAIITGGARGQGAVEAELFVQQGAQVIVGDVLDAPGEALARRLGEAVRYVHLDVTQESEWSEVVAAVIERCGGVDVLVNNAGIFRIAGLLDTSLDSYEQVMAVNATGIFLGMKAVAPTMISQGDGCIINISSVAGLRGSSLTFAYSASKWAIRGMTRSAARQLGPHGVRVNSVHPGIIDTDMAAEFDVAGAREAKRRTVPLGREGEAAEVAELVLFLCSHRGRYANGAEFVIDGGMTC